MGRSTFYLKMQNHFGPSWSEVTTQLPDKLSESEIPANSSGIKITSVQVEQKLKLSVIGFDFVAIWHELAPYQIGERCGSCPFTCDYSGGL